MNTIVLVLNTVFSRTFVTVNVFVVGSISGFTINVVDVVVTVVVISDVVTLISV